ncbi:MAG: preprotein translocase subunit SecG [Micavibrio aeruginosavorus]|nr:preprotein translocase subunit SecG [Micavibrio aeruginosavorus]
MFHVVLVIHLILALAIIAMVLLQRSEGGGLGMGSGGGLGGIATPQATANVLTRATWVCVSCFFVTSLVLGILAGHTGRKASILDQLDQSATPPAVTAPAEAGKADGAKPETKPSEPSVPTSE